MSLDFEVSIEPVIKCHALGACVPHPRKRVSKHRIVVKVAVSVHRRGYIIDDTHEWVLDQSEYRSSIRSPR